MYRSSTFRRWIAAATLAGATLLPYTARAQDPCDDLESCIREGKALHDKGNVDDAIVDFKHAMTMNPGMDQLLQLYFNLAGCFVIRGEPHKAIAQYELFLSKAPADNPIRSREEVMRLIANLRVYEEGIKLREQEKTKERRGESANYSTAIERLLQAHGLARTQYGRGIVLRDLGITQELAGDYGLASESFEGYLREFGERARDRKEILEKIEQLREWERNPPVAQENAAKPMPAPKPALSPSVSQSTHSSFFQRHLWSTVSAGAAVVLGTGSIASLLWANREYDELKERCISSRCSPADAESVQSKDRLAQLLGAGAGLSLAAAAVIYYFELPAAVDKNGLKVEF